MNSIYLGLNSPKPHFCVNSKTRFRDLSTIDQTQQYFDISSKNPEAENSSLLELSSLVYETEPNGRIQAEFDLNKLRQDRSADIILQNSDEIFIPEKINHIYVYGEISNQGTIRYKENEDVNYYINKKGGLLDSADSKSIYVLLPNGETFKLNQRKRIFSNNISVSSQELYPGSIIFIPREIDDSYTRRQSIQAYVGILGNLGISLASLSVLKDQNYQHLIDSNF